MSAHTHSFDGRWPFSEPEDTLAICCEHVFQHERAILCVLHDNDGDWQFLCGDAHSVGEPRVICMGCALELDGTLVAVASLPLGWGADRALSGAPWVRKAHSEPDADESSDA